MIFKSGRCLIKISGGCPINKPSASQRARSMKMLRLLQDNYSQHSTNMSNKTSQRVFSGQPRREAFIILPLQSLGNVTRLLKSKCFGCWLTDLWNTRGWSGLTEKPLYVCVCDQLSCSLVAGMFTQTPKKPKGNKGLPRISVADLWGYHTCSMRWMKNRPRTKKKKKNLPHSEWDCRSQEP